MVTHRPLIGLHAAAFSGLEGAMGTIARSAPALPSTHRQCGKAVVFANAEVRVGDLRKAAKDNSISIADIPAPETLIQTGEPICCVFAGSSRESETEQLLANHAEMIRGACLSA